MTSCAGKRLGFLGHFALAMLLGFAMPVLVTLALPYNSNLLAGISLVTGFVLSQLYWLVLWRAWKRFGYYSLVLLVGGFAPLLMTETFLMVGIPMEIGLARTKYGDGVADFLGNAVLLAVSALLVYLAVRWIRRQYRSYRAERLAEYETWGARAGDQ